jgi:hypothetical protein
LDAAKIATPLMHEKPNSRVAVVVERPFGGLRKAKAVLRHSPVTPCTPEWRAKISAAIKRGNERRPRSPLAATDPEHPTVNAG